MTPRVAPTAVTVAAVAYLALLAWSMTEVSYDIWGGLIVLPPLTLLTVLGARRLFRGRLRPLVAPLLVGFAVKVGGNAVRYWVAFDAYGGSTDAQRYHLFGRAAAGAFWSGDASLSSVLPSGQGTPFVEHTTAFVYTLIGSSRMAGFIVFGWLAYWGVALTIKAVCIAVPGVSRLRYAYLCMVAPSLVYWPSSIGKEALMMCFLGIGTYGVARLVTRRGLLYPVLGSVIGIGGAGLVRPHVAAIWLVGLLPALLVALGWSVAHPTPRARRRGDTVFFVVFVAIVVAAVVAASNAAVSFIEVSDEQTSFLTSVDQVLRETTRRSDQGGSNFAPPAINGPQDWPFAAVRTLTRPLPFEASGLFQSLAAIEMTAYLVLCAASWRRIVTLPRAMITTPFVTFAVTVLLAGGLAYASFANMGILTRQKSLLMPFLLLLPCLPPRRRDDRPLHHQVATLREELALL